MSFTKFLLGKRHRLSWIAETSYGSGGTMANGEIVGIDARLEPDFNPNWQEVLQAGADDRFIQDEVVGPLDLPFTLTFTPVNSLYLKYCGYSISEGGGGGPSYTHTFAIANVIQSFKLEWALRASTNVVFSLTGCTVLGATITFQKSTGEGGEGFVTVALRCVAKAYSIGSSVTTISAGNITRSPLQWRHVALTFNDNEIAEINNGEITIDQGIDPNDSRYCNATLDRALGEPIPKTHRISGSFNANMKDSTFPDGWATAAVITNCKINFTQAADNKLEVTFASFRMVKGIPATVLDGVTNVDVPFKAQSFTLLRATDTIAAY